MQPTFKKALIVIALIGTLIAITAALYFLVTNLSQSTQKEGTFGTLVAEGGSRKCAVTITAEDHPHGTGTTYVSDGNVRSDFMINLPGMPPDMTVPFHTIATGEYVYSWSETTPFGSKGPRTSDSGDAWTPAFAPGAKIDYVCESWATDPSVFALPEGVEFTEMMGPPPGQDAGLPQPQQSI